jgi:hypothetical protein
MKSGTKIYSNNEKYIDDIIGNEINIETIKDNCLHLNHYAIQSYNWFKHVKMTRGDATSIRQDNVRNEHYFKSYDWNEILDDELKNKQYIDIFNWQKYYDYYPDLQRNGLRTKQDAINHWNNHGSNEGRIYFTY